MPSNKKNTLSLTNGFEKKSAVSLLFFLAINSLPGYTQTFDNVTTTVGAGAINSTGGTDVLDVINTSDVTVTGTVDVDNGNDDINVTGNSQLTINNNLRMRGGADELLIDNSQFTVSGSNARFDGGADTVTIRNGGDVDINGNFRLDAGNDNLSVEDNSTLDIGNNLTLDNGADTAIIQDTAIVNITNNFNLGSGNDTLRIRDNADVTVGGNLDAGGNNDTLRVRDNANLDITGDLLLGSGNDDLRIRDNAVVTVSGNFSAGNGADTVSIRNGSTFDITGNLSLNGGNDTLEFLGGTGNPTITVGGNINGNGGTDSFLLNNGANLGFTRSSTAISNFEDLGVDNGSTLTLTDDTAGYNNSFSSSILIDNGSTFNYDASGVNGALSTGSITIDNNSTFGTAAFSGASPGLTDTLNSDLYIINGSTFNPGRSTTINGNFANDLTSTVQIEVDASTPLIGVAGQVNSPVSVNGNVILSGNIVLDDVHNGAPTAGTEYTVMNWTGTRTSMFTSATLADAAYLDLVAIYNANNLVLQVMAGSLDCTLSGLSDNAQEACNLVNQAVLNSPTGDVSTVLNELFGLDDAGQANALEQVNPSSHFAMGQSLVSANNIFIGNLRQRFGELRAMRPKSRARRNESNNFVANASPLPYIPYNSAIQQVSANNSPVNNLNTPIAFRSDDDFLPDNNFSVWARGIGGVTEQESYDQMLGNTTAFYGGALGFDYKTPIDLILGASVGFIQGDINHRNDNFDGDISSTQFALYSTFAKSNFHIDGILSLGIADNDTTRAIKFGSIDRKADADYNSYIITGRVESGYDIHFGPVEVGPIAALEWNHLITEGFTETGAGSLNVTVNKRDRDYFKGEIGARIATDWSNRANTFMIVPEATLRYQRQFLSQNTSMNYSLFGIGATATGIALPRNSMLATAGVTAFISPQNSKLLHSIFAYYSNVLGIGSKGYMQHAFNAGYKMKF